MNSTSWSPLNTVQTYLAGNNPLPDPSTLTARQHASLLTALYDVPTTTTANKQEFNRALNGFSQFRDFAKEQILAGHQEYRIVFNAGKNAFTDPDAPGENLMDGSEAERLEIEKNRNNRVRNYTEELSNLTAPMPFRKLLQRVQVLLPKLFGEGIPVGKPEMVLYDYLTEPLLLLKAASLYAQPEKFNSEGHRAFFMSTVSGFYSLSQLHAPDETRELNIEKRFRDLYLGDGKLLSPSDIWISFLLLGMLTMMPVWFIMATACPNISCTKALGGWLGLGPSRTEPPTKS